MAVTIFQSLQNFTAFLGRWTVGGGGLVDPNVANMRAEICVACHANVKGNEARTGCGVCNKGANRILDAARNTVIGTRTTPLDDRLKSCAICGCVNSIAVHFPNHALIAREDADAYPTHCWRKKILTNEEI